MVAAADEKLVWTFCPPSIKTLLLVSGSVEKLMVVSYRLEDLVKEDVILMKVGHLTTNRWEVHCEHGVAFQDNAQGLPSHAPVQG